MSPRTLEALDCLWARRPKVCATDPGVRTPLQKVALFGYRLHYQVIFADVANDPHVYESDASVCAWATDLGLTGWMDPVSYDIHRD